MTFLIKLSELFATYTDEISLYSKWDQVSDWWQQLKLDYKLFFDLRLGNEVACWFQS